MDYHGEVHKCGFTDVNAPNVINQVDQCGLTVPSSCFEQSPDDVTFERCNFVKCVDGPNKHHRHQII